MVVRALAMILISLLAVEYEQPLRIQEQRSVFYLTINPHYF